MYERGTQEWGRAHTPVVAEYHDSGGFLLTHAGMQGALADTQGGRADTRNVLVITVHALRLPLFLTDLCSNLS